MKTAIMRSRGLNRAVFRPGLTVLLRIGTLVNVAVDDRPEAIGLIVPTILPVPWSSRFSGRAFRRNLIERFEAREKLDVQVLVVLTVADGAGAGRADPATSNLPAAAISLSESVQRTQYADTPSTSSLVDATW